MCIRDRIASGQSLGIFPVKLDNKSNAKEEIENLLAQANFNAFIRVQPGNTPISRIVLVRRDHIERLEQQISDKREWVINIRSASNVLLGEGFLYAFPVALPDKNIVRKGEVIVSTSIDLEKINSDTLGKQIKLLLTTYG